MTLHYDKEYLCTYPYLWELMEQFGEYDVTEILHDPEKKHQMETIAYQTDLRNVFYLPEKPEETHLNDRIQELYAAVKQNVVFQSILEELLQTNLPLIIQQTNESSNKDTEKDKDTDKDNDENFVAFTFLFCFELFLFAHPCFCELLENGTISTEHEETLRVHIRKLF